MALLSQFFALLKPDKVGDFAWGELPPLLPGFRAVEKPNDLRPGLYSMDIPDEGFTSIRYCKLTICSACAQVIALQIDPPPFEGKFTCYIISCSLLN